MSFQTSIKTFGCLQLSNPFDLIIGDRTEENAPMMDRSKEHEDSSHVILDNSNDDEDDAIPDMADFVQNDDVRSHAL
jgi:hypothetical protein